MKNNILETSRPRQHEHRLQVMRMVHEDYTTIVEYLTLHTLVDASYRTYE